MPHTKLPFEDLPSLVLHQISQTEALLDELKRELHHCGPDAFANEIENSLKNIRSEFSRELEHSKVGEELIEGTCLSYLARLRDLSKIFPLLAPISNIFIPNGLLLSLLNFTSQFGSSEVSFSPTWDVNYELIRLSKPFDKFRFISYPCVEWTNTLLHVMLIHEVFHYIEQKENISKEIGEKIDIGLENPEVLSSTLGARQSEEIEKLCRSKLHLDILRTICRSWLGEVVCDLLSVMTAGPAYPFALIQLGQVTNTMDLVSSTHPPTLLRLKYTLMALKEMNYLKEPHSLKELEDWDKKTLDAPRFIKEGPLEEMQSMIESLENLAYKLFQAHLDRIPKLVKDNFLTKFKNNGLKSFDVACFEKSREIAERFFSKGIPCIDIWDKTREENEPIDMFTIWNAGWVTYLRYMPDFYSVVGVKKEDREEVKEKALTNFNAILLKSLESSEILRRAKKK